MRAIDKSELNKRTDKFMELMTFDLIDFMTQNTVVTSKQHFRDLAKDKKRENFNDAYEHIDINNDKSIIEKDNMDLYKYLESGIHNISNISR